MTETTDAGDGANDEQARLWALVYSTIRMNETRDSSLNGCLNFLANERRTGNGTVHIDETTAIVREEIWTTDQLNSIDVRHNKMHDFDDDRPIVIFEHGNRRILVDGNHRVARWLALDLREEHRVLLISLRMNER